MRRHFRQPDRRRGVVLIIVVGVLAVLMLMAGTLALLSRVGHQMSVSYDHAQALDALSDAVQTYAIGTLYQDKYGADGLPYDYERQGTAYPGAAYPPMSSALWGDDEGFDSYANEEWLPGPASDGWRMFATTTYVDASWLLGDYGVRVDLNGDGIYDGNDWMVEWQPYTALDPRGPNRYGPLTGTNLSARVSLYFEDMGAARIDINAAGNANNAQNQGLTPFELDLGAVTGSPASLISARQGGGPGAIGWLPGIVDRDADGTIGGDATDFTRYSPLFPDGNETPFGDFDLNDLFQLSDGGSRAAGILVGDFLGYFTTQSAGTNLVGRSLRSSDAWDSTDRGRLLNSEFLSRSNGGALPSARPLNEVLLKMSPREIAAFLEGLGPEIQVGGALIVPADTRVTRQIATNLKDMVDADSTVCVWRDEDGNTYYGVEPTPNIVEGEAAVPTWYVPTNAPGPLASYLTPPVPLNGQYGKYIKLANPWNVQIRLDDFELRLPLEYQGRPRLRRWVRMTDGGDHNTVCSVPVVPADVGGATELRITFPAGAYIPARGHYVIAEDTPTLQGITGNLASLDPNCYTTEQNLRWMQECVGRPLGIEDTYKLLNYTPQAGGFNAGDAIWASAIAGSGSVGVVAYAPPGGPGGRWLLVGDLDPSEHFRSGEPLYKQNPDIVPPPGPPVYGFAVGVAEPIYDLFEVDADTLTYDGWVQTWAASNLSAFNHAPGAASAVGLFQTSADTYVMFTVLPDSPVGSDDDEDDWPLMTSVLSGQMDDPRPCWYRYNPETSAYEAPSDPLAADAPWSANAWDRIEKTGRVSRWNPATTQDATWYNRNWLNASMRHGPAGVLPGDGWNAVWDDVAAVPLPDSLLFSFPPVVPEDGWDGLVPCYTGAAGQQTAVQNRGLLPNPGSVGFVHAGLPWTTLSLTSQHAGPGPQDMVYIPGLLDYVAGPRGPYESRAAHTQELSFAPPDLLVAGTRPRTVAAGDFNGDGRMDVVAANEGTNDLTVYYNMGNGAFRRDTTSYGLTAGFHRGLAAADLDRDGYADVVVSNAGTADVSVFDGGPSGLGARSDYGVGSTPRGLTIRDLNGDGRLDVAVACSGANQVTVLLGQALGGLGGGQNYAVGTSPSDVAAGDFDGDGRLDLAVANEGDNTVTILRSQPAGGFAAAPGSPHAVGNAPAAIVVGDFGRPAGPGGGTPDGKLDVVTANFADNTVTLLYGAGDGTFGNRLDAGIGLAPLYLIASDFNGDGVLDVASGVNGSYLGFLLGQTAGGLGGGQWFQTDLTDAAGVAAADFDGNGTLDLAVAKPSDNYVAVLRSTVDTSRICGRINVNTASAEVLAAVFNAGRNLASAVGQDIVDERNTNGPFTSLDDFFDRMGSTLMPATGGVYGFRSEALARFMANLITTRTDVWGVRGRVQLFRDLDADDAYDAGEEIVAERNFYMVVDRSQNPVRTLLMRYPPQP